MKALKEKLKAWLSHDHIAVDFFLVILLTGLFYRLQVYYELYNTAVPPFSFSTELFPFSALLGNYLFEIIFGLLCLALFIGVRQARAIGLVQKYPRVFSIKGLVVMQAFLVVLATMYGTHYRLMFSMHIGLQQEALLEADTFSFSNFIDILTTQDILFIISPIVFFWLFRLMKGRAVLIRNGAFLVMLLVTALIYSFGLFTPKPKLAKELQLNPIMFAAYDIMTSKTLKADGVIENSDQRRSLKLIDPDFIEDVEISRFVPPSAAKKWNVLFFVLESTGDRYIYDTSYGNDVPMPFLRKISRQSLRLNRHYSPSNSSPRSVFAMMSGLYPVPSVEFFSVRRDIVIPSLAAYLGKSYENFLVTPAVLRWYFPTDFMKNSGIKEMYGYYKIPADAERLDYKLGRHEAIGMDFFLKRLNKAREPFFATYITFAGHWPYPEFDPDINLFTNTERRVHSWVRKYYNNLRLQDKQLERLFKALEQRDLLESTIVVIVGDHSEAFGQHKGNWTHARATYEENIRVPAYLYAPGLFTPGDYSEPTAHIDILPTLLDAMKIKFNRNMIQGESLFQSKLRRKYIFVYGNQNALSSISKKLVKVEFDLKHQTCQAYDLKTDPTEHKPIDCGKYPDQKKALLKFLNYQTQVMPAYNKALIQSRSFFGNRHLFHKKKAQPDSASL